MKAANHFRLGMDLDAGTTHAEDAGTTRHLTVVDGRLFDEERDDHFIRRDGKVFAGTHLIIEVVDGEGLDDERRIQQAFRDCVEVCGATLLHIHTHKFSPQGVSGVAVLAESHISVHTWPEIGYGAFDVFMCGEATPWRAVEVLRAAFDAGDVRVRELLRGEDLVAERL
ncbi:MAG: adenosylmethionine decarboxylase [Pseudomonadota bacterium]